MRRVLSLGGGPYAKEVNVDPQLVTSDQTFYLVLLGSIVPIAGYLLNRFGKYAHLDESIKGIVQLILTALVGYAYSAWIADAEGLVNLSQGAFSSVVASLFAHNILWKPANINVRLGATPSAGQLPAPPIPAAGP